jgi:hypothetical protein
MDSRSTRNPQLANRLEPLHTIWCPACEAPQSSRLKICGHCGNSLAADVAPLSARPYWLILLAAAVGITLWVL